MVKCHHHHHIIIIIIIIINAGISYYYFPLYSILFVKGTSLHFIAEFSFPIAIESYILMPHHSYIAAKTGH
jgi:hypothetical protein